MPNVWRTKLELAMIHLDTNYLIGLAVRGSSPAQKAVQWLAAGELLAASTLAWAEFLELQRSVRMKSRW